MYFKRNDIIQFNDHILNTRHDTPKRFLVYAELPNCKLLLTRYDGSTAGEPFGEIFPNDARFVHAVIDAT